MSFHPRRPPHQRSAFTVLELMIALALLVGLLAVAWSILGSYRNAEQRGWQQAYRLQVVRAVRELLEEDAAHWQLGSERAGADMATERPTAVASEFVGDPGGFQVTMLPSLDPLPWLAQVTAPDEDLTSTTDQLGESTGTATNSDLATAVRSPLDRVRVTYRLSIDTTRGDEASYRLQRSVSSVTTAFGPWQEAASDASDAPAADEILTVDDLYRSEESEGETFENDANIVIRHLVAARFRYSDGTTWQDEWDSLIRDSLPRAIELRFDHPAARGPYDVDPPSELSDRPQSDRPQSESLNVSELAAESTVAERDVRIVIRVPTAISSTAFR
jgi:type II secretory pathway pseudopilin PulG